MSVVSLLFILGASLMTGSSRSAYNRLVPR